MRLNTKFMDFLLSIYQLIKKALILIRTLGFKRVSGIEPPYPPWQGGVLPLNYTRNGGSDEIRTRDLLRDRETR